MMVERYEAIDIANYIIWFRNTHYPDIELTHFKLQNIIYYITVAYIKKYGQRPFSERIEKWQSGPVVPSVFHSFKGYGISNIDRTATKYQFKDSEFTRIRFDISTINPLHIKLFDNVIKRLISLSLQELISKSRNDVSWKRDEEYILSGIRELNYTCEDLKSSFFTKELNNEL